jgi:hypothetical protein
MEKKLEKKIGVWGWWNQRNVGDNWILANMFGIFGKKIIPVRDSVTDFSGFDFMICGGGGLFAEKIKPPWNKETLGVPYGVFCIGTEHGVNSIEAERLVKNASFFYTRDVLTYDAFNCKNLHQLAGDVTFYKPIRAHKIENALNILLLWRYDFKALYKHSSKWTSYIGGYMESRAWEEILATKDYVITCDFNSTLTSPLYYIKNARFIVSQRFHGVVAAIQAGIPVIAIDVCPKIRAIMKEAGLDKYCIKVTQTDQIKDLYEDCFSNLADIRQRMQQYTATTRHLVQRAATEAKDKIEEVICGKI